MYIRARILRLAGKGYPSGIMYSGVAAALASFCYGKDSEAGFAQAAVSALRQAMQSAEVSLEEPVMAFEIQTPAEFASGIIADLNSRQAELTEVGAKGALRAIAGKVPLSAMFGYSTAVRSLSQGRASFSMIPAGHRAVPESELAARGLIWQ